MSVKKKDPTLKELEKVDQALQQSKKMQKYKVEPKQVRKVCDVSTITASTVEALI